MGSQKNYLKSHFSTFGVSIKLLVAMTYQIMQKRKVICTKNNKAKLSYNLQFHRKQANARTRIYLTNKLFEILFLMFS